MLNKKHIQIIIVQVPVFMKACAEQVAMPSSMRATMFKPDYRTLLNKHLTQMIGSCKAQKNDRKIVDPRLAA